MRQARFSSPTALAIAGAIVFPLAGIAACGGHTVSLGTNQAKLQAVDPATVGGNGGAIPACGAGAAHPNVCCQADPKNPAKCGVYPGAPFHPCDTGWTTYPDPRSCCDLAEPSKCGAPPPQPGPTPTPVCSSLCPPGWYSSGGDACCQDEPEGGTACYGWASSGPGVSPGGLPADAGAGGTGGCEGDPNGYWAGFEGGAICIHPDSGAPVGCEGDPNGYWNPWDGGLLCIHPDASTPARPPVPVPVPQPAPSPSCNVDCPAGWVRASGAPDVCCRDDGNGTFECFSQSTGPIVDPGPPVPQPGPIAVDAGPPSASSCSGRTDGYVCGCQGNVQGHSYSFSCTGTSCFCTADGKTFSLPPFVGYACNSGTPTIWTDCGFPN